MHHHTLRLCYKGLDPALDELFSLGLTQATQMKSSQDGILDIAFVVDQIIVEATMTSRTHRTSCPSSTGCTACSPHQIERNGRIRRHGKHLDLQDVLGHNPGIEQGL